MKIIDLNGIHEVSSVEELDTIVKTKHGDAVNSFWLSHEKDGYPTLSLLVKGDLATLNYVPEQDDAGFRSIGNMPELNLEQSTMFALSSCPADDVVVLNDAVVPFAIAWKAAKEFFTSKNLPRCVDWMRI